MWSDRMLIAILASLLLVPGEPWPSIQSAGFVSYPYPKLGPPGGGKPLLSCRGDASRRVFFMKGGGSNAAGENPTSAGLENPVARQRKSSAAATKEVTVGSIMRVKSPITGRLINVGGPAFQKVIELGYILHNGHLVHRNVVGETAEPPLGAPSTQLSSVGEMSALRDDVWTYWPGVGEELERFAKGEISNKLRPIFDKLQEDDRVDLIQLRTALMTVNVSITAAQVLDLLHLTDEQGRVMLEYDDFERLMLSIPLEDPNAARLQKEALASYETKLMYGGYYDERQTDDSSYDSDMNEDPDPVVDIYEQSVLDAQEEIAGTVRRRAARHTYTCTHTRTHTHTHTHVSSMLCMYACT
jgi:hypothetical protein